MARQVDQRLTVRACSLPSATTAADLRNHFQQQCSESSSVVKVIYPLNGSPDSAQIVFSDEDCVWRVLKKPIQTVLNVEISVIPSSMSIFSIVTGRLNPYVCCQLSAAQMREVRREIRAQVPGVNFSHDQDEDDIVEGDLASLVLAERVFERYMMGGGAEVGHESRQDGAREDGARQDGSIQDAARQDESREDGARQDECRQDESRQDSARQDGARQNEPRQDGPRQDGSRQNGSIHFESRHDGSRQTNPTATTIHRSDSTCQSDLYDFISVNTDDDESSPRHSPTISVCDTPGESFSTTLLKVAAGGSEDPQAAPGQLKESPDVRPKVKVRAEVQAQTVVQETNQPALVVDSSTWMYMEAFQKDTLESVRNMCRVQIHATELNGESNTTKVTFAPEGDSRDSDMVNAAYDAVVTLYQEAQSTLFTDLFQLPEGFSDTQSEKALSQVREAFSKVLCLSSTNSVDHGMCLFIGSEVEAKQARRLFRDCLEKISLVSEQPHMATNGRDAPGESSLSEKTRQMVHLRMEKYRLMKLLSEKKAEAVVGKDDGEELDGASDELTTTSWSSESEEDKPDVPGVIQELCDNQGSENLINALLDVRDSSSQDPSEATTLRLKKSSTKAGVVQGAMRKNRAIKMRSEHEAQQMSFVNKRDTKEGKQIHYEGTSNTAPAVSSSPKTEVALFSPARAPTPTENAGVNIPGVAARSVPKVASVSPLCRPEYESRKDGTVIKVLPTETCTICAGPMRSPMVLPCRHRFCRSCLVGPDLTCPECGGECALDDATRA